MVHESPPAASWVPYRKVITQFVASALFFLVALGVTKLGIHESATAATVVSSVVGWLAGGIAGYIVKEGPQLLG